MRLPYLVALLRATQLLGFMELPSFVQYIALDGDSLTTEDLVNLGKGRYKIKVWGRGGVSSDLFGYMWKPSVCSALPNVFLAHPNC